MFQKQNNWLERRSCTDKLDKQSLGLLRCLEPRLPERGKLRPHFRTKKWKCFGLGHASWKWQQCIFNLNTTKQKRKRKRNKEKSVHPLSPPFRQKTNSMEMGAKHLFLVLLFAYRVQLPQIQVTEVRDKLHSFSQVPIHLKLASLLGPDISSNFREFSFQRGYNPLLSPKDLTSEPRGSDRNSHLDRREQNCSSGFSGTFNTE